MEDGSIVVEGLTKVFNGFVAVDHISFSIKDGELFGLLGPNGAGKSTTMRMLTTLLRPTEGDAYVGGHSIKKEPDKVRLLIGLVSDKLIVYDRLTARENLRFFGNLYGLGGKRLDERIDELLEEVNLSRFADKPVGTFSTGMKQRLNLVRALLHNPKVLFLDEPTLGLDPQTVRFIKDLIIQLHESDITIVLTTHEMALAEELSERLAIIDHGKILAIGEPKKLEEENGVKNLEELFLKLTGRQLRDSLGKQSASARVVRG
ncbi:ATP-binding cassette domain-containing protein [Tardisphaera miroshnichenkoae]